MTSAYPDIALVRAAAAVLDNFHPPTNLKPSWHLNPEEMAKAVIAAAAPHIAAQALREEAKRILRDRKLGGMARLEFTYRLRSRADEIESGEESA
jgi:hypothetical protein